MTRLKLRRTPKVWLLQFQLPSCQWRNINENRVRPANMNDIPAVDKYREGQNRVIAGEVVEVEARIVNGEVLVEATK